MDSIENELLGYNDDEEAEQKDVTIKDNASKKGHYVGVHSTSFRDFILSPELMQAIADCGFEHPSQVQQECIPQALLSTDIIAQGKSGMGKTAIFVISVLQLLDPVPGELACLCIAPTRELAYQICSEFNRFTKHMTNVKTAVFYGGMPTQANIELIKNEKPNIVIATPGRCLELIRRKNLDVSKIRFFIIDEADKVLEKEDMRRDVHAIYEKLPQEKQSMLFSATMPPSIRDICRSFTRNAAEIFVDDDKRLTLHGLQQYYLQLQPAEKNRKLLEIFDNYSYNQIVIFVDKVARARALDELIQGCGIPSIAIHSSMKQADRIAAYRQFKTFEKRILVCTDVIARGIDIERVNIVINYDMPRETDTYLHRVGRAGRFGTKGLAISFVSSEEDQKMLAEVQKRFEVQIPALPEEGVESATYMNA